MDYALHIINSIAALPAPVLYLVIIVWLILESAGAPIPNEAVLLFSGYLISLHSLSLPLAWLASIIGTLGGASLSWKIAVTWGPAGVHRFGRYIFLNEGRLEAAQAWFKRWGPPAIFAARLTPVVRTVISYPAGLGAMPYRPFIASTAAGCAIWNLGVLLLGNFLGPRWIDLFQKYHTPALVLGLAVILLILAYLASEHAIRARLAR